MKFNSSLPISHYILTFCFYLSLLRGTNMGLFYPANEFQLGEIDYTPQTIMNFVLLLGLLSYFIIIKNFHFLVYSLSRAFIFMIVAGVTLSLLTSVDRIQSAKYVLAMIVVVLPSILYLKEYGVEKLMNAFVKFIIISAFLNIAYVLILPEYGIMTERHEGRWRGLFEHKNMAGTFFALSFFFIWQSFDFKKTVNNLLKILALIFCLLFIFLAQSATAFVIFIMMSVAYPAFIGIISLKNIHQRIGLGLALISTVILMITFFGGQIESLFFTLTGRDATLTGRTGIWEVIFDLVSNRPFTGFGAGMSERPEFMERIQSGVGWEVKGTHNAYLDLLINFGYPTTIIMVLFILKNWTKVFFINLVDKSEIKIVALASGIALTCLIVGLTTAATLYSRSIFWIFLVIALMIISYAPYINKKLLNPKSKFERI
jgi:exopolysaccharide production protein ExoQ